MKNTDPHALAEQLVIKYSDQAYFKAVQLQRMADQVGDVQSAILYQDASKELKSKGYDRFEELHKLRIPIVSAAGGVIMSRQTFDEMIRELERAGVNVLIERPSREEQKAFNEQIMIAAFEGEPGSRIHDLLDTLPDTSGRTGPDEEDELAKLERRIRAQPAGGAKPQ